MKRSREDCRKYFQVQHKLTLQDLNEIPHCTTLETGRIVPLNPLLHVMGKLNSALVDTATAHRLVILLKQGKFDIYKAVLDHILKAYGMGTETSC